MGTLFVQQGNLMWRTFTWDGQTLKVGGWAAVVTITDKQ
jgi:hypothetical protein